MLSIPQPGKVLGFSLCLLGLLAGCDANSTRYPKELRYPARKDILVVKQSAVEPVRLHSPGQLDESIREGLYEDEVVDGKTTGKRVLAKNVDYKDPANVGVEQAKALRQALLAIFGTPMQPKVEADAAGDVGLEGATLSEGSELYRKHCMHCHGVSGDGRGPTGPWVNPHPRDYRSGKFKFISNSSTYNGDIVELKPSRTDLARIVQRGIDGTSMPAFNVLPEREIQALVSYVIHLSIRGEVEFRSIIEILARAEAKSDLGAEAIAAFVTKTAAKVTADWALMSNTGVQIKPDSAYPDKYTGAAKEKELADSIERGYKIFTATGDGGCIACHGDFGRQATYRYDAWGTLVQPRNLTVAQYRGGRRPIDFYWRVRVGISPSGMPAQTYDKGAKKGLTDEDVWDVVHFVQNLPYPLMLPKSVRDKVYGPYMSEPKAKKEGH